MVFNKTSVLMMDAINTSNLSVWQGNPGSDGPPGRDGATGIKVRKT